MRFFYEWSNFLWIVPSDAIWGQLCRITPSRNIRDPGVDFPVGIVDKSRRHLLDGQMKFLWKTFDEIQISEEYRYYQAITFLCRPMYQLIYWPISTNTLSEGKVLVKYWWSLGEVLVNHQVYRLIGVSVDTSVNTWLIYRPILDWVSTNTWLTTNRYSIKYRLMHWSWSLIQYMIWLV